MTKQNIYNLVLVAAILGLFTMAFAPDAEADLNVSATVFNIDTDIADFRGINLDVGYDFTDLIGVRGSYMIGAEDEVVGGVNVEITDLYSFDAILRLPLSDTVMPYFTVGKLHIAAKASYAGYSATAEDNFTTYGAGIQFNLREAVTLSAEFKDISGDAMTMLRVQANF